MRKLFLPGLLIVFSIVCMFGCSDSGSPIVLPSTSNGWKTPVLIETDNTGGAYFPQVAMNASGNAVAVWIQDDGGPNNVWSNRYTASTGLWGTPVLIETDNINGASDPYIAIDATGNAIAVWSQRDSFRENIWSNRYSASTGTWGTAALIETDNSGDASQPQIAMDASGNAVVVWGNFINARNMMDIWANRYDSTSGLWGAAELIETDDTGHAYNAKVAIDVAGNAMVVWSQKSGTRYNICSNRYSASTGLWGAANVIETDNAGDAYSAQIAMDIAGNAMAVWYQHDGARENIWANRYSELTGLWGTAVLIETDNTGGAYFPQIAMDTAGNAMAVWRQEDGTRNNIWSNRYSASTGFWGTATLIETDNSDDASNPEIAMDVSGNAVAVWRQGDGTRDNIWSNRYTASSGHWGIATLIETDNSGHAGDAQVAMDATGRALAVWQQYDGTRNNILSNIYK